jgi:hypothetical protein
MITNRDIQIEMVKSAALKLYMLNLPANATAIQAHTAKPHWCRTWARWVAMIKYTIRED